jgi:Tol biopolymer transport system component
MNKKKNLIMGIFLLAGVSFLFSSVIQQETAKELFERALYLEETKGDLEKAIEVYSRIVKEFPDEQATAAKAQLQIGICYEKLGMKEAQTAYQQVIDKYPKQTDVVAVARERLAGIERSLAELNRKPKFRKIEIATKPQNGVLSPEGDKLAFISEGAVWVVPLHGKVDPDIAGEPVRIADVPGVWDNGSLMAWSADGEWIAVNGGPDVHNRDVGADVCIIPAGGGEPRVIRTPDRGGHSWSFRLSLSPDGQQVAISALELGTREEVPESHNRRIYTIPTAGGEPKQVSSSWARLPSFSPDGRLIAYVGYRKREDWRENTKRNPYDGDLWVAPLAKGKQPVKLATVDGRLRGPVWSHDGKYIAAHHEPGNTNDSRDIWVYALSPDASRASEPIKISLPRSSWNILAGWTPDGELGVFIQSEQHDAIYTVPASGGKAVQITSDVPWPYYPRWSPDGERIYFRTFNEKEKVTTVYVPAAGGEPVEVPLLSERWLVSRVPGGGLNVSPDGETIVVSAYQEPYDPKEGVDVWTIPVNGGRATRLTSDGSFEGYPCWSPDGKWIAFTDWYKKSEDEGFNAIYIVPAKGGEIRQITSEADGVDGGAIAFSLDGKRIAFFSGDTIKTIPVQGGQPEVLVAEAKSSRHSQLAYSPDGSKIAHSVAGKIWINKLDGGVPEELRTGLPNDVRLSEFGWSPDGEKIAFFASSGGDAEFWLVSDFLPQKK